MTERVPFLVVAMNCAWLGACGSSEPDGPHEVPNADGGLTGDSSDSGGPGDAGYPYSGGVLRADRFIAGVVSVTQGACGGFGSASMPGVVYGPPIGGGESAGGLDVVSLGTAGEIVVSFGANEIVDGPGPDFIVFENAFDKGGDPRSPVANLGEVSVSADHVTWKTFSCTATAYPYGACAGWHPVYSNPQNGISPVDPAAAGGDAFDLADVGLASARFVKIVSKSNESCDTQRPVNTNGFDLDAISLVNARLP